METIFLSYTYRPHPAHQVDLDQLRKLVVRVIEAMRMRVIDGVDVGGRPLDDALRQKIGSADGLVALVTPQADNEGKVREPTFVLSEFQYAESRQLPTMRVMHHLLQANGLGAHNEYAPYEPGRESLREMLVRSDAVVGLVAEEEASPWVIDELRAASAADKPSLVLLKQGSSGVGLPTNLPRLEIDAEHLLTEQVVGQIRDMVGRTEQDSIVSTSHLRSAF